MKKIIKNLSIVVAGFLFVLLNISSVEANISSYYCAYSKSSFNVSRTDALDFRIKVTEDDFGLMDDSSGELTNNLVFTSVDIVINIDKVGRFDPQGTSCRGLHVYVSDDTHFVISSDRLHDNADRAVDINGSEYYFDGLISGTYNGIFDSSSCAASAPGESDQFEIVYNRDGNNGNGSFRYIFNESIYTIEPKDSLVDRDKLLPSPTIMETSMLFNSDGSCKEFHFLEVTKYRGKDHDREDNYWLVTLEEVTEGRTGESSSAASETEQYFYGVDYYGYGGINEIDCENRFFTVLEDIYVLIIVFLVLGLLLLSMLDFVKAISNDDADAVKKASKNLSIRLGILIIIIIAPAILNFIFEYVFPRDYPTCIIG